MPTEDAYSSRHLVLSHFGTCMCSNVETNLSWTCLVSGLLNFEHPSVLLFCLLSYIFMSNLQKSKTQNLVEGASPYLGDIIAIENPEFEIKNKDSFYDIYTSLNGIQLTIWTMFTFRVFDLHQWSLTKQSSEKNVLFQTSTIFLTWYHLPIKCHPNVKMSSSIFSYIDAWIMPTSTTKARPITVDLRGDWNEDLTHQLWYRTGLSHCTSHHICTE